MESTGVTVNSMQHCIDVDASKVVSIVCAAHDKLITRMCSFQHLYVSPSNLRAFNRNHCCCCCSSAAFQLSGCLSLRQNCIFQQIARDMRNVCIHASVRTCISRNGEKFLYCHTNWCALCGYGKIMQLIYWHIIGWLEYGNFSFILLTPFVCIAARSPTILPPIWVFRVASEWIVLHSAWTRVLFVFANRLRYSLYGHKITRRMWEVDFHSCTKRVTLCFVFFFFYQLEHGFFLPDQTANN